MENIIAGMPNPPEMVRAGTKAFYSPLMDCVTLPTRELFVSAEEEACTTAHELAHSTGHPKRLAREGIAELAPFGSPIYSREELVAELSASYLCAEAGISNAVIANQAAYVAGWLKKLRDVRRLMIHAQPRRSARRTISSIAHMTRINFRRLRFLRGRRVQVISARGSQKLDREQIHLEWVKKAA
jgi:antirestriction protein ArdC